MYVIRRVWVTKPREARRVASIVAEGTITVGDSEAIWWDVTVDDSVDHAECQPGQGPPDATLCVAVIANDNGVWSLFDTLEARLVFIDDADAILLIENWSGKVSDVWEAQIIPIMNTLSVRPVR